MLGKKLFDKYGSILLIVVLLASYLVFLAPLVVVADTAGGASTELINYSGFTSQNIATFVSYCVSQGITEVTLRLPAYTDFTDGALASNWETTTLAIITACETAGIDVNIDIHTWYTTWDTYFDDAASNYATHRSSYATYVTDVVNTFKNVAGVKAFMVLNEPQWQYASASENNFIITVADTAQALTDLPIGIRFMAGASPWESSHHYWANISDHLDFYCINAYWNPLNPDTEVNNSGEQDILDALEQAHADGKELWVTEFGSSSTNEETQRAYVEAWVTYANSATDTDGLAKDVIDRIFCWASSPTQTESYNIWNTADFTPKDAFLELGGDETTPTPTPTPAPSSISTNLAPCPSGWTTANTGMYYGIGGVSNVVLDNAVTHNGNPSVRVDPVGSSGNLGREVNSYYLHVSPGDTIVFSLWIKTSAAASGETDRGARFGVDIYGSSGRIVGAQTPEGSTWVPPGVWPSNEGEQFVDWGSDWTYKEMSFVVNATYPADYWSAYSTLGQAVVPVAIIPWLQACSSVDGGQVWYADVELYITSPPVSTPAVAGALPTLPPYTSYIIQTNQSFLLSYANSEGFNVQDVAQNILVNFVVTSGALQGTGNLNVTNTGGEFLITPSTSGTMLLSANTDNFYVTINGQPSTDNIVSFVAGSSYFIIWQYVASPNTNPSQIIIGSRNSILYFRSDSYSTNNLTAYGLDNGNTNSLQTLSDSITSETVIYGFRVWVRHSTGLLSELTDGSPEIQVTRSTDGTGWQNTTWLCPNTDLDLGKDALEVDSYISLDGGLNWTAKAKYVTHPILSVSLLEQTWTFNVYTSRNTTTGLCSYGFGSRTINSNIGGVGMEPPTDSQLQSFRLLSGDYIGFILGAYFSSVGSGATYVLFLMIPALTLYLRHRHFGPVALFVVLFGGSGGFVFLLLPAWAAIPVNILLSLGIAFIIWRLIR